MPSRGQEVFAVFLIDNKKVFTTEAKPFAPSCFDQRFSANLDRVSFLFTWLAYFHCHCFTFIFYLIVVCFDFTC